MLSKLNDQIQYELLKGCLDASDVGVCVIGSDRKLIMLNQHVCRMLGVDALNCLDKPAHCLFADMSLDPVRDHWVNDASNQDDLEIQHVVGDKVSHFLLKKRSIQHHSGESFRTLTIHDITALNDAKQFQQSSQRQWQALNAGVVISDARLPGLPIIYVNPAFETMTGYTAAEIMGRNCSFLQGNDRNQEALNDIRRAIDLRSNGYAVLRNYRKNGTLFINELFISPVFDHQHNLVHYIGIQHLRDQTFLA